MATKTALLQTSPLAVETELRRIAEHEMLGFQERGESEYPYLFGMACYKLAEANTEWLRLVPKAALVPDLLDVLHRCAELLDDYSDVVDGDDGPLPNRAMSLLRDVEAAIAKAEGGTR